MLRGRPPEALPVALPQRRIYVLPSAAGVTFAGLLGCMLLASLNYNLSLGFGLTFILAGVANVSLLVAHRNLLKLRLVAGHATPVFAGTPQCFELNFADPVGRPRRALTLIATATGSVGDFEVPAHGSGSVQVQCPTERRGRHRVGPLILETRYPLGLIRAWAVLEPAIAGLVYPAPEPSPPPPPRHGTGTGEGRLTQEGGSAFDSLRGYRPGDSPRAIAWRTLARGGPLATKVFADEHGEQLTLSWFDCPATLDTESRIARLCAWALAAEEAGNAYGMELPGLRLAPARGPGHLHTVLEALALYGDKDAG